MDGGKHSASVLLKDGRSLATGGVRSERER